MLDKKNQNLEIRKAIISEIQKIEPFDETEANYIKASIKWIEDTESIFRINYPNDPHKHLVTAFIVYDINQDKFLLFRHINAQLWLPGGGHVEVNEHPKDAVIIEMKEEINLDAEFIVDYPVFLSISQTVNEDPSHTDVSLCYLIHGDANKKIDFDKGEFEGYQWFGADEIPFDLTDLGVKRFIEKFKSAGKKVWINQANK